ncbi:hypothetical protein FA13DRAFT_1351258 [Coprinellus micaceus]|uniref:Uncharacterized protein n=1 Tax=Coprinellus micaceus TaxID=71717 RepID=A0A4Y7TNN8_COPMI|nr:hypothetical protein FA13DRAFT_1351258 [Coprinellus micaceus]
MYIEGTRDKIAGFATELNNAGFACGAIAAHIFFYICRGPKHSHFTTLDMKTVIQTIGHFYTRLQKLHTALRISRPRPTVYTCGLQFPDTNLAFPR